MTGTEPGIAPPEQVVVGAHNPDCAVYTGHPCNCKTPGPDAPAGEWAFEARQPTQRGATMSGRYDWAVAQQLHGIPFDALIMAAVLRADTTNLAALGVAFPELVAEATARYHAPDGVLPGEDGGDVVTADWRVQAACRQVDPEVFFPTAASGPLRAAEVRTAKAVCWACPVREQCLDWALDALPDGVAGGKTEVERAAIRRRRAQHATRTPAQKLRAAAADIGPSAAGRDAIRAGMHPIKAAQALGVGEDTGWAWSHAAHAEAGAR